MALSRWKRLSTSVVHQNPYWRYRLDTFEQANGRRGDYHYVSTTGSVMVVPIRDDGSLVMVEQYRFLGDRVSLEFPAGGVHAGEPPLDAAIRELAEEAGLEGDLRPLGAFCPWNGVTDELCHVFLATNVRALANPPPPDETEEFVVRSVTRDELDAAVRDGSQWDGMTLAAYAMARAFAKD